jgi:hypothetical protein
VKDGDDAPCGFNNVPNSLGVGNPQQAFTCTTTTNGTFTGPALASDFERRFG